MTTTTTPPRQPRTNRSKVGVEHGPPECAGCSEANLVDQDDQHVRCSLGGRNGTISGWVVSAQLPTTFSEPIRVLTRLYVNPQRTSGEKVGRLSSPVHPPKTTCAGTATSAARAGPLRPVEVVVDRMGDIQETGAIDWLLIEAHDKEINGELVPPLLDLVDRRLIRILDVLVLVKRGEGDFDALTTADLDPGQVGDLGALAGASSGLLSDDDAAEAAAAMQSNSLGLLIVYENLWSVPFAVAARRAGGQLVAQGHIPTQALLAALDALES